VVTKFLLRLNKKRRGKIWGKGFFPSREIGPGGKERSYKRGNSPGIREKGGKSV